MSTKMNKLSIGVQLLLLAGTVQADLHHLFTSSIATPHLFSLEFDDVANTLIDMANMTAHDGHPWISFSYDKATVYAGEKTGFASYAVLNNTALGFTNSIAVAASCSNTTKDIPASPYVLAELKAPFTVFGASAASCGAVMSVDIEGKLQDILQEFKFRDGSAIKGMALDPDNKYLFSADEKSNGIWTHYVSGAGTVIPLSFVAASGMNEGPRRVVVHPAGKYLYAVMGRSNTVAVYAINSGIRSEKNPLTYTGVSYSLLPPGTTSWQYQADEVLLSVDSNVLYATTRYIEGAKQQPKRPTQAPQAPRYPKSRQPTPKASQAPLAPKSSIRPPKQAPRPAPGAAPRPSPQPSPRPVPRPAPLPFDPAPISSDPYDYGADEDDDERYAPSGVLGRTERGRRATQPGFINAILLTELMEEENPVGDRRVGAGFPIRQLFQLATTTGGGLSNTISPAPWSNEYFALADSEVGLIEVWKMDGLRNINYNGTLAAGAASKAAGGWVQRNWTPAGSILSDSSRNIPQPKLAPQSPKSTSNRKPTPVSPTEEEGLDSYTQSGRGRGDRPSQQGQRGQQSSGDDDDQSSRIPNGADWGYNDSDDDDDDRRKRISQRTMGSSVEGPIPREQLLIHTRRQASIITARVVASWRAPVVPTVGRRVSAQEQQVADAGIYPTRRLPLPRKLWTGSKRADAPPPQLAPSDPSYEVPNLEGNSMQTPSQQQGLVISEEEEKKAAAAGRSCCGNALWFD